MNSMPTFVYKREKKDFLSLYVCVCVCVYVHAFPYICIEYLRKNKVMENIGCLWEGKLSGRKEVEEEG